MIVMHSGRPSRAKPQNRFLIVLLHILRFTFKSNGTFYSLAVSPTRHSMTMNNDPINDVLFQLEKCVVVCVAHHVDVGIFCVVVLRAFGTSATLARILLLCDG